MFYYTIYTTPNKFYFFTITNRESGEVVLESAVYETEEYCKEVAAEIVKDFNNKGKTTSFC